MVTLADSQGLLVAVIVCLVGIALSRQYLRPLLSSPAPKPKSLTFRVDDVPIDHIEDFGRRIRSIAEQDPVLSGVASAIVLRSLVPRDERISCATVSIVTHLSGDSLCMRLRQAGKGHPYTYSCNFEGITPLYEAEGGADVDIIAVPGLGSHALGSWKSSNSDDVWLRDFLPKEIPTIRVLLYGYDTVLPGSLSKQSIKDLGSTLLERITAFRAGDDTNRRPLIFIGHSLGGLLIKEALVQARRRRSDTKSDFSKATFGLLFFGVPNLGLRNEQLRTLVRGQPNESLINDLLVDNDSEPSNCLKSLADHFSETCQDYYQVVSFFERSLSPTIELGKDGKWRKTGRPSLLVTGDSATSTGLVAAADEDNIPLNTDHSGLVKFDSKSQGDYPIIRERIKKLSEEAKVEVARRFAKHDLRLQHSAESEACMNSLAFQDIYGRQNNIETTVTGTCDWIFSHPSFQQWTEKKQGLLWIMGKPGSGKSTILKYALQKVPYLNGEDTVSLSFFFHARGNEMQRTQLGLFRSLLHQLLWQVPDALSDLVDEFRRKTKTEGKHKEKWDWDLLPLQKFFESALPKVLRRFAVIIFIDALDECGEKSAVQLIQYLKQLIAAKPGKYRLSICFTCRYYPVVNSKNGLNILLDKENQTDIITYIQTKFHEDPDVHIENLIVQHARGVFLWAQFVVDRVLQLKRQGEPRGKIEAEVMKTPQDLEDLYHGLIEKVQDRTESLRLAQWICFSTRPLTTHELSWAMAYQPDCTYRSLSEWRNSDSFIAPDNMDTRLKFLSCGLAEIVVSRGQRTVQFIHQSVKDYFIERGLYSLGINSETASMVVPTANRLLAWTCIRCLNLAFSSSSSRVYEYKVAQGNSLDDFLEYATISWFDHMKLGEPVEKSPKQFLGLLEWPGGSLIHSCATLYPNLIPEHLSPDSAIIYVLSRLGLAKLLSCLILEAFDSHLDLRDAESGLTPLSCAARYAHEAVVQLLLDTGKVNVNSTDKINRSPLNWAVRSGNEHICKMLLETGDVDGNLTDEDNWSPLSLAAETENFHIVKNIIETGNIDVNRRSSCGRTPLSWAASTGNEGIVKFLLDTGKADASVKDDAGRSPLSWAAADSENADLFRMLLAAGKVDINEKDFSGRSPLSWAAGTGDKVIVELLIFTGKVDINSKDVNSRTPFSWAAVEGHDAVIALLLGTGEVEVDTSDRHSGRTPLSLAAKNGHEAVVKRLLDAKKVDVNSKDVDGRTPFSWAATHGHVAVVATLLGTGVVELDSSDRQTGRTSLSWAAGNSHTAVVEILLRGSNADVNSRDINGRSPLSWAAGNGHAAVVKLLVNTGKVDIDSRDDSGLTPLWLVAAKEYQGIMKLLLGTSGDNVAPPDDVQSRETPQPQEVQIEYNLKLKRLVELGTVTIDQTDTPKGRTPLSWAAMNGYTRVVKMFLDAGNVEPDSKDNDGRTPLCLAARNNHFVVVVMLLDTGRVNANSQDNDGRTPLWWSARNAYEPLVDTLVFRGGADVNNRDNNGQTPLIWAAENGRRDMVRVILGLPAVSINTKDNGGWTALSCAARNGHKEIVKDLLATGEVDTDPSNTRNDRMPLSWAAECGHKAVVEILLSKGGLSINSKDNNGWTALSCASRNGHVCVVDVLLATGEADVNSRDNNDQTPLWWAVGTGHADVVRMLLNTGNADVGLRDNHARTPLLLATDIGDRDIVMMLLNRDKTHVDSRDDKGRTPLLLATANGRMDLARLFLDAKRTDIISRDNSSQSL